MAGDWRLEQLGSADAEAMLAIFNHYINHGFAAYLEEPASVELMHGLLDQAADLAAIGARDREDRLIGFSLLRTYLSLATFSRTAQITTFIAPECTGRGLGTALIARLEAEARTLGLTSILAHVSSRNPGSLAFHGKTFDIIWFQKML